MSTLTPDTSAPRIHPQRSWPLLIVFLVVVLGMGTLIGFTNLPGDWYAGLNKPPFNPPNWIFGPVWTLLYILIAIAGWRTFTGDRKSLGMTLWVGQMLLNWLWTPLWFGAHLIWPAFVVITLIDLAIFGFIIERWTRDRPAALLFVPYAAWVSFAAILNLSIGILN